MGYHCCVLLIRSRPSSENYGITPPLYRRTIHPNQAGCTFCASLGSKHETHGPAKTAKPSLLCRCFFFILVFEPPACLFERSLLFRILNVVTTVKPKNIFVFGCRKTLGMNVRELAAILKETEGRDRAKPTVARRRLNR